MGWKVSIPTADTVATLCEDELTGGEWELFVGLVSLSLIAHSELDIRPSHCPACRNAAGVVALAVNGIELDVARARVGAMPRTEMFDHITYENTTDDVAVDVEVVSG